MLRLKKWLPGLLIAAAMPSHGSEFGLASLQQLIAERSVGSVESLIAALPDDLRSHYALVFESRSLQGGSFSHPRVILFGSHASFVLTFNGDPAQRGYNAVEIMEFDSGTQRFLFREMQFDKDGPHLSAVNSPRCVVCHGSPARPIWDTPPLWPGVYGQRYHAGLSLAETRGIAAFLALQQNHQRYHSLLGARALADRTMYVPDSRAIYEESSVEPPNALLSALLTGLNSRSILSEMAARPTFQPHRYVLLAAAEQGCGRVDNFYPIHLRAQLATARAAFDRIVADANARQQIEKSLRGTRKASVYRAGAAVDDMIDLRFVAENSLAIDTARWTLAFERGTYDLAAPDGNPTLASALFEWVAQGEPRLRDLRAYRGSEGHDRYCEYLRQQSVRALGDYYSNHGLDARVPAGSSGLETSSHAPDTASLLGKCAACHTGDAAPLIPFADRAALARQLTGGNYRRGRLVDEILYRLDPRSGAEAMPRGIAVTSQDRRDLEQYSLDVASSAAAP